MPDAIVAAPPRIFIQPHHWKNEAEVVPPRIFVGNQVIEVSDKGRAAQWARILIDYVLSAPSQSEPTKQPSTPEPAISGP